MSKNCYVALAVFYLLLVSDCHASNIILKDRNIMVFREMVAVPTAGNTWMLDAPDSNRRGDRSNPLENWSDTQSVLRTYFRLGETGFLDVALVAHVNSGRTSLDVSMGKANVVVSIDAQSSPDTIYVGRFMVEETGYHHIDIRGLERDSELFAGISHVLLGGEAIQGDTYFVKDDFYWGRRGPSVHLSYPLPEDAGDIKWFYNEVTVPVGEDVIGSFYMANGFGEGYFGIQVNSTSERRVLFSVWSPFNTDNPREIPEDQRIIMLAKGKDVNTGEFGNEGSGGQSFLRYNWQAGNTYRFLLKGVPSVNNSTDYTAYFFAPEEGRWRLIASFRRPQTTTFLKRQHSFLENFIPDMGRFARMAYYNNQWVMDVHGTWHELTVARFTADATARKESRLDYAGGSSDQGFFLKNCGFFNETTPFNEVFSRTPIGIVPNINFDDLPEK